MTPRKQPPVEVQGQMPLDGMPVVEPSVQRFDPNRRRAFGSVPGLLREVTDYSAIVESRDVPHLLPQYLEESLYGLPGQQVVDGLALNSIEYSSILIHKPTFVGRIAARAAAARTESNPIRQEEVVVSAPLHALERVHERHTRIVKNYSIEADRLQRMKEYARTPSYARTNETTLRILGTEILTGSFHNLLDVVALQRGWSDPEIKGARQLLARRLFEGPQRDRVGNWRVMLGGTIQYTDRKKALFTQRLHVIESGIAEQTKILLEFYAKHDIQPTA